MNLTRNKINAKPPGVTSTRPIYVPLPDALQADDIIQSRIYYIILSSLTRDIGRKAFLGKRVVSCNSFSISAYTVTVI